MASIVQFENLMTEGKKGGGDNPHRLWNVYIDFEYRFSIVCCYGHFRLLLNIHGL